MNEKKEKKLLMLSCIAAVVNALTIILTTEGIAKVMECVEVGEKARLPYYIMCFVLIIVFEKITSVGFEALKLAYITVGDYNRRVELVKVILKRAIYNYKKKNTAYYYNLITSDVSTISQSRLGSYPWIFYFVAYFLFAVIMLLRIDVVLTIIIIVLSFMPFLLDKLWSNVIAKCRIKHTENMENYLGNLKETLDKYDTIKNNYAENRFIEVFKKYCKNSRISYAKVSFASNMSQETLYLSASILQLVALIISSYFAATGRIHVAMIYAAMNYSTAVSNSFSNISNYHINIKSTKPINEKITGELNDKTDDVNENVNGKADDCTEDNVPIKINNLSFGFGEKMLYKDFTYFFEKGKKYAVVGESGSGKSTLLKLVLKNFCDYEGTISIFGHDIRNLAGGEIMKYISVVQQEPCIFNTSLYENITMYNSEIKEESEIYKKVINDLQLEALSKKVGDKKLGDFGSKISGGERQRICLARAVLRNTPVLFLDESTNGLDPVNKRIIEDYIFSRNDLTIVSITHDWTTENLEKYDYVIQGQGFGYDVVSQ